MNWSLKHIEDLKSQGKIRGYKEIPKKSKSFQRDFKEPNGRVVSKHFSKRSKEKDWIAWNLLVWCNEHAVTLEEEYRFNQERKWRADWCIPAYKILVEYEGGIFKPNGDHRSIKGMSRDIAKYHSAQALGYKVIRLTAVNYKEFAIELERCL